MRVLVFTNLYPNSVQTRHGIFVENRILHLKQRHPEIEIKVVAPVPWFPFKSVTFGQYGKLAAVPKMETRSGITVYHPRYPVIPKVGMNVAPFLMGLFILPVLKKMIKNGLDFDLIDSHFFYPDGAVAVWLGKKLNKPVTVTARGSDIHLYPSFGFPNKVIKWALRECQQAIAVCKALADEMLILEPASKHIDVCRNGVDLQKFVPATNREALRAELNIDGFTLLSVGNLIELKGHHLIIDALLKLEQVNLIIIGDGPWLSKLHKQVELQGLQSRVCFAGLLAQNQLQQYYAAADALVLASSREGWANVLLESMACGTPVVATAIWGTPEVVAADEAGVLIQQRTPKAVADGIKQLMQHYPNRHDVRNYAQGYSWDATSDKLFKIFNKLTKHNVS
jgi:teichuronic acid biosynthesis glycosyltransferase TuaC